VTPESIGRDDVLTALRASRAVLDRFGVTRLSLFGSFARDEADEESDIDLVVEFGRQIGLFEFARLQRELGELLGRRVELVTLALKPPLRAEILREAIFVSTP